MAALFTLAFALGGFRTGLTRLSDNSFFWHLETGRWILDHGVPREDPYSFTAPGVSWVAQSWLAEALYGLLDRVGGPFSLRLLGAVTGALIAGCAYRLALRLSRDRIRALGVTLAAIAASFTLWSERPLFLGILAFVGLLWIVEIPDSLLGRHASVTIPVLMWLWANVHGSFALGFAYLGLHLVGRWWEGAPPWRRRERQLVMAALAAAAVISVNPYGPKLLLFPFDLVSRGDILRRVTEWRSPDFRSIQGMTYAAWLVVWVAALARGRHRPGRRDVVVSLPFALLALWAQRNIALAPLVGLPVVGRAVAAEAEQPDPGGRLQRPLAGLLAAMALLWTVQAASVADFDLRGYPVRAVGYLEDEGLLGKRLASTDKWGGYLILAHWPEQKVFIDDRYDMYPVEVTSDFIALSDAERRSAKILDRYDIEVVLWPRDALVVRLLEVNDRWRRVYRDDTAAVLVRSP